MKKKNIVLVLAGIFVVLMLGAYGLYTYLGQQVQPAQAVPQKALSEGEKTNNRQDPVPAPDFTVYDAEGNTVGLTDFAGKPVVLNFWASWCGPCKSEMPHFEQAYQDMGADVNFVMVNMTSGRETLESAQQFIGEMGYTFPVFYDTDMDAAMTYGVYSLPMTVFIDAQGYVVDLAIGAIDEATLLSKIEKIR